MLRRADTSLRRQSSTARAKAVIDYMKRQAGFNDVLSFLEVYFTSQDRGLRTSVGRFVSLGGFRTIVAHLLAHPQFAERGRVTVEFVRKLKERVGDSMIDYVLRLVELEMKLLGKHPISHLNPDNLTLEDCEDFTLDPYDQSHLECAPLVRRLSHVLYNVKPEEPEEPAVAEVESEIADEYEDLFDYNTEGLLPLTSNSLFETFMPGSSAMNKHRRKRKNTTKAAIVGIEMWKNAHSRHSNSFQVSSQIIMT